LQVLLTKTAQKDLTRIPKDRRSQVLQTLRALESWPLLEGMDIARLKGYEEKVYRLRIGDYRVVFLTAEDAIYILRVVSRQELEKVLRQLRP
jgi:mRNA interferase RelE/StbE